MTRGRLIRLALALVLLLGIASWLFGDPPEPEIEPGSTLVIEIAGEYVEQQETPLLARALGERRTPLVALLSRFSMARRDDRLATVVLRIGRVQVGWAKAQEIRSAILDLREAGRRVVAHLDVFGVGASREFYMASAADELHFAPGAGMALVGLAAEYMYLGGAWEKLGLEIDVTRVGKYKSATEAIAGQEMSDPAREMANSLLDSIYEQFVAGVAEGRGVEPDFVRAAIDAGPVLPDELEALGLIDGVVDFHELLDAQPGETVTGATYAKVSAESVGFDAVAQVALIYGSGNVVSGRRSSSPAGSATFASRSIAKALDDAGKDPSIDAILFRIDSPGGSAAASEEIWQALERAQAEHDKPIVASLSDMAASGGYYVVSGADAIVSAPATLTGSIGVFVLRPILGGLLDKLGVNVETLTRGRHADLLLATRAPSEAARRRMQRLADATYALFTQRVSQGRGIELEAVDRVAQGRVWTGKQALEVGLVDDIGGISAAVDQIRRLLELDDDADVSLLPYPQPGSLVEQFADLLGGRASLSAWLPRAQLDGWSGVLATLIARITELPPNTPLLVPPLVVDIR